MSSSTDFSGVPLTLAANPFRPGMGIAPPHLAGREAEQGTLLAGLEQLRSGQPVNGLVLSAPRGLGKTVLLRWLAEAVGPTEMALHNLNANQIPSVAALAEVLAPPKPPDAGLSLGLHAELAGASAGLEVSRTPAPPVAHTAHEHLVSLHLRELAKRSPLVVIVDEAHSLAPEVARALCNQAQALIGDQLPSWLILAGTPGLMPFLMSDEVGSSFVERAEKMRPDPLSAEATQEALLKPLAVRGWSLPPAGAPALNEVVEDSQGYPYFIQLWGSALWKAAVERGEKVWNQGLAEAARADVDAQRDDFYDGRHRELSTRVAPLDGRQVRAASQEAAQALLSAGAKGLTGPELESALQLSPDVAEKLIAHLESVGFIVRRRGRWQAGIPSLAGWMLDQ